MTHRTPRGFVSGNDRIARYMSDPDRKAAVDAIREGMARMNAVYAEGLADIRKASTLTQQAVAERLGTDQGSVSRIENREDLLLSTLAQYLRSVGAENTTLVTSINGMVVELSLDQFAKTEAPWSAAPAETSAATTPATASAMVKAEPPRRGNL